MGRRLSYEEYRFITLENEKIAHYNPILKMIYLKTLSPLKHIRSDALPPPMLPLWSKYAIYGLAFVYCSWCSFYVFMFSVYMNRCSECDCGEESCTGPEDTDNYELCVTCPEALAGSNNLDSYWIQSVIIALIFSLFIQQPLILMLRHYLVPSLCRNIIGHNEIINVVNEIKDEMEKILKEHLGEDDQEEAGEEEEKEIESMLLQGVS